MFNSNYYKNRFVYELENGYKAMVQLNLGRNEYYYFLPNNDSKGGYDIYLRKLNKKPLHTDKIQSLGGLLQKHGFCDFDFMNPVTRTKKIVMVLDVINDLEKGKVKIKK